MSLTAQELKRLPGGLLHWQVWSAEHKALFSSGGFLWDGRVVLVDPLALSEEALAELDKAGPVRTILLTSQTHGRAAALYRKRYGARVWAHESAVEALREEVAVDGTFENGDIIEDCCQAVHTPGPKPSETAFLVLNEGGTFFVGDSLVNMPPEGLRFLPEKYADDPATGRASLRRLLEFSFEKMLFAHGDPLMKRADRLLRRLLDEADGHDRRHPAE